MKKSVVVSLIMLVLMAPLVLGQQSKPSAFDRIVGEYYRIHDALARDTTEGVSQAAQNIVKFASQAEQIAKGPDFAAIKRAASGLQGKSLAKSREAFFELSKPIIAQLKRNPASHKGTFAYKCSMANKSWVQDKKEIRNPYYGKSMLKCGEPL